MDIAGFKTFLAGLRPSGTVDDIPNLYALLSQAATKVLARIDPPATTRLATFGNFSYNSVSTYPLPTDAKSLIALISTEVPKGKASFTNPPFLNLQKSIDDNTVQFVTVNGVPSIQIDWTGKIGRVVHPMTSFSGNGLWKAIGGTTGIKTNTINKIGGNNVVEFTVAGQGDGIKNTNFAPVDILRYEDNAVVIVPLYIDNASNITSVRISLGNNTIPSFVNLPPETTQADGTAFVSGVNYLAFKWKNTTKDDLVPLTMINAAKIQFNATASTLIRVGSIMMARGYVFMLRYLSKCLFTDGVNWFTTPTQDTDTIVVQNGALKCLAYETMMLLGGDDAIVAQKKLEGDPSTGKAEDAIGLYRLYNFQHESKKTLSTQFG